ncbi:LuxR C-terminal-related transcriptional regulator [Streptomyces sp. ADMS]|uniref:LuxR C-terminal-related transcriptional regulator n=1 Tax=Streptomyces sp. ADMS TaxID=3071415 RepID=UPI00296E2E74|nr:LuxR C-terminal-related transcriptional regulator [Streptomyces sp. ADMS]MDW4903927.1 LuxR C-terminal-related transcriptional regulator [Streptomyces sp. ADMS]
MTVPRCIRRQRLLNRLTTGANGPLTLVTGPAGAGKTTLVAAWARTGTAPGPVVWVSLDGGDTPGVFWAYVLEAYRRALVVPTGDIGAPAGTASVDRSLLVRLAAALERLTEPVVLVLDDLDRVPGREVASGLEFLLDRAGTCLRLVVISRTDPLLPLHRYRAESRLYELRGADLAFTQAEAAALLRGHGLEQGRETVAALVNRTEGWAAGLRLCALAMQESGAPERFVRSFTASENAVADYLLAEVLEAQPAEIQELLVRTSILNRVHPELADVLTGREDAERILARLVRDNAFVEPIPDTRWCRFHPLFSAVLHAHLRSGRPGLEPELHHLAAHWLVETGQVTEALGHAAEARDWQFVAAEAVRHLTIGGLFTGHGAESIERMLSPMPENGHGAEPTLVAAARRLSCHDTEGCRRHLARAEPHLHGEDARPTPEALLLSTLLRLLSQPCGEGNGVSVTTAEDTAQRVRELMAQVPRYRIKEHPEIEALRRYGLAWNLLESGHLVAARMAFEDAVRGCMADATDLVRHETLGRLALVESICGALTAAEDHALGSLAVADQCGIPVTRGSGAGHLALAAVASERGDTGRAEDHLERATAFSDIGDDPVLTTERAVVHARVELARGARDAALKALGAVDTLYQDRPPRPPWAIERLAVARSTVALARGDAEAALTVLDSVDSGGESLAVALALGHLASGRTDRALRLVATTEGSPELALPDLVRVRLLRAHVAMSNGDREAARRLLAKALDAAAPERMRRPFTEAGPWLPWLRRLPAGPGGLSYAHSWLTNGSTDRMVRPSGAEPLSGREREVLACVAQMMSTQEIAAELHLSVNTVKTHLKSIYRKLGVSRRRAAVERGRELHFL